MRHDWPPGTLARRARIQTPCDRPCRAARRRERAGRTAPRHLRDAAHLSGLDPLFRTGRRRYSRTADGISGAWRSSCSKCRAGQGAPVGSRRARPRTSCSPAIRGSSSGQSGLRRIQTGGDEEAELGALLLFLPGPAMAVAPARAPGAAGSIQPADDLLDAPLLEPDAVPARAPRRRARRRAVGAARQSPWIRPRSARLPQASAGGRLRDTGAARFMVQRRTDPVTMPIEDSTIEWQTRRGRRSCGWPRSRSRPALRLAAQMAWRSGSPTRRGTTLPEHAPLGHVNRTRRVVYEACPAARHELNGTPRGEPAP